jgi:hypothetical protein
MRGLRQLHRVPIRLPLVLGARRDFRDQKGGMKEMQQTYAIPNIVLPLRLAAYAGFAALGMAVQILLPGFGGAMLGAVLMIPGILLVWMKGYRNKPLDLGLEDWQPVSAAEFARVQSNLALTKQRQYSVFYKTGFGVFILLVLLALVPVCWIIGSVLLALFFFDAAILLLPLLFSSNVRLWTPGELAFKMHGFETIVKSEQTEGGDIIITPYLRLDKDKEGRRIPEDIRLMVEPRRKPEDFLGVQMQVAVNKGPNGPVPYMYAVFLCKGKGVTYKKLEGAEFGNMVSEPGGDAQYGYIVVRQQTSGTGYHTKDSDIRTLYDIVKKKLLGLKGM